MFIWKNLKPATLARAIEHLAPHFPGNRARRRDPASASDDRAALRRRPPRNAREAADMHLLRSLD